jgi:hypothetical protein
MRWTVGLTACAALVLASCGAAPGSSDTQAFVAGLSAFETADQAALDAAMTKLRTESAGAAPCTAEAFAAARRDVMRQLLEPMSRAGASSLSEEARFLVLATALNRDLKNAASPAEACKDQAGIDLIAAQDTLERGIILQAVIGRAKTWQERLAARHGDNLQDALGVAAGSLQSRGF